MPLPSPVPTLFPTPTPSLQPVPRPSPRPTILPSPAPSGLTHKPSLRSLCRFRRLLQPCLRPPYQQSPLNGAVTTPVVAPDLRVRCRPNHLRWDRLERTLRPSLYPSASPTPPPSSSFECADFHRHDCRCSVVFNKRERTTNAERISSHSRYHCRRNRDDRKGFRDNNFAEEMVWDVSFVASASLASTSSNSPSEFATDLTSTLNSSAFRESFSGSRQ